MWPCFSKETNKQNVALFPTFKYMTLLILILYKTCECVIWLKMSFLFLLFLFNNFAFVCLIALALFVKNSIFSQLKWFSNLVKNKVAACFCLSISKASVLFHVQCVCPAFFTLDSIVLVSFSIKLSNFPIFLFVKFVSAILDIVASYISFKISQSISIQKTKFLIKV